jgi:hypothetical protein
MEIIISEYQQNLIIDFFKKNQNVKTIVETKIKDKNEFIKDAKEIHGNKYDYSKVDYKNNKTDVIIVCPIHGDFPQRPDSHLNGKGCKQCGNINKSIIQRKDYHEFIKNAKNIHGDKYDYSKVEYKNKKTPVLIGCPIHGYFSQTPRHHVNQKQGCKKCGRISTSIIQRKDYHEFINNAKKIHGDKYDYSKVEYKNKKTPVLIGCPIHGYFSQLPRNHVNQKQGCPSCNESKGEKFIADFLKNVEINFERQRKFIDCTNTIKGRYCKKLPFDFYIPNQNTCIEYDGKHHYFPIYGEKEFEKTKINDLLKTNYCKEKGIKLIRLPYTMSNDEIISRLIEELDIE